MERWYRSIPTYQCSTQLPSPPKRLRPALPQPAHNRRQLVSDP